MNMEPASFLEETASATAAVKTMTDIAVTTFQNKKQGANRMTWDNHRDLILIGEVILVRPFQFRQGTRERGRAWQTVADNLKEQGFKVDRRSVRDRINHLMEKVKDSNKREKAASGIAVEESDEEKKIRESVEEFIQEEEDTASAPREKGDEERKKASGEEMRKRACETFRETQKRQHGEDSTTPKRRNSGLDTMSLIHKKMELDQQLRREEMEKKREAEERKRAEERDRDRRYEAFQQQQAQQQQQILQQQQQLQQQIIQQQQQLFQQQYQQSQTLMMALLKSLQKN